MSRCFESRSVRGLAWVLSIGVSVLLAFVGEIPVARAEPSSEDTPTFVSPPQQPTEVSVGAYLIGLSRVSEPSEPFPSYQVEMFLNVSWQDPRLAFGGADAQPHVFLEEEAEEKLSEIWSPDLGIQNEIEQRRTESVDLSIFPDGTVDYEERFGATLHAELDLHRFPFDQQLLDIELESFSWDKNEAVLVVNEEQTGFDSDFHTPEWSVSAVEGLVGVRSEIRDDRDFSSYTLRIHASRHAGHYLLRILLPLFFVMTLTWFAFWESLEDRFRVGFIALLTVVAIHAVVAKNLPRLAYPTLADMVLMVCYLVATALTVVSIVVQRVDARGEPERAERIDRWARRLLPVVAAVILGISTLLLWM